MKSNWKKYFNRKKCTDGVEMFVYCLLKCILNKAVQFKTAGKTTLECVAFCCDLERREIIGIKKPLKRHTQ